MLNVEYRVTAQFNRHLHLHSALTPTSDAVPPGSLGEFARLWGVMRHHGAPTRVLDWSYSPYVALYFAIRERFGANGEIWWFSINSLNDRRRDRYGGETSANDLIDPGSKKDRLFAFDIPVLPGRAAAQQGMLTFCENIEADHAKVLKWYFDGHPDRRWFGRLVIPAALKREFLLRLRMMNIDGRLLFPDMDGLGMAAVDLIRSDPTSREHGLQYRGSVD